VIEKEVKEPNVMEKIDGYWEIISNWSTCTVKCGGGTQTM
jgi:hypothetical protein